MMGPSAAQKFGLALTSRKNVGSSSHVSVNRMRTVVVKDNVVHLLLAAVRSPPILIATLTPFRGHCKFLVTYQKFTDRFSEPEWGNEARANLGVGVGRIVEIHYEHPRERGTWRNPYTPQPKSSTTSKEPVRVDHIRSEYGKHTAISGRSGSHAHHLELFW